MIMDKNPLSNTDAGSSTVYVNQIASANVLCFRSYLHRRQQAYSQSLHELSVAPGTCRLRLFYLG